MIFILCSIHTFYCVLHKQLYRSAGFVLHLKWNLIFSCSRTGTDHLCWKLSPPAALTSPAWLMARLSPEAKGPAISSVGSEVVKVLCYLITKKTPSQPTQGSELAQKEHQPSSCGELLLLQKIYVFFYRSQKYIMDQEDNHNYKENRYVLLHPLLKCPTYRTIYCNPYMEHSLVYTLL